MKQLNWVGCVCWVAVACALTGIGVAQPAPEEPVRGPFWSGTIRGPKSDKGMAMKGIAVTVGAGKNAYVCYDTDLMNLSMAWTGEFLSFGNTLTKIEWPPPPQVRGTPVFGASLQPGWGKAGSFADPRPGKQGPMPKDWVHYRGLTVNGDRLVLQYTVGKARVMESPWFEEVEGQKVFTRTFSVEGAGQELDVVLLDGVGAAAEQRPVSFAGNAGPFGYQLADGRTVAVAGQGLPARSRLAVREQGRLVLTLPKGVRSKPFRVLLSPSESPAGFAAVRKGGVDDLKALARGGKAQWPQTLETRGIVGTPSEGYAVDTLVEPANNPFRSKTFFGGHDFFEDGRAAICTFHGDVWIISGVDETLSRLVWKRYATGLFQPLGLKVVGGKVYVLGRDQITRLHDLNNDGEADFYENFNNDTVVTANYHEFSLDLHTDPQGNFYFAKGAPWEPEVTSPHQGCILKVSADGSRMEVVATGLRAPNGMTVGPKGEITVGDNQGHWMPSSKLNWVVPGGFYGMTPAAQKPLTFTRNGTNFTANPSDPAQRSALKFRAWGDATVPQPSGYDEPIVWLPMGMDNSSGGQVWATSNRWGPMSNQLLFMSYGKCTLFNVMLDEVDGVKQGAMVQFPLRFTSGVMRGRVNPKDGQVYLSGLKGWQNSASKDGGFYRVRYTGGAVHMPTTYKVRKTGVELGFTCELDPKTAADPANYSVERWNYRWTGAYGSAEYSVKDPNVKKHDPVEVKSARVLPDGKTVALEFGDMKRSDQLKIKFSIDAKDGAALQQEVYGTVRRF